MIKCRKVKITHNKSHGASDKYRKPEYPKMPCNFDIGVAECLENTKLLSVCTDIVFNIKEQHYDGSCNEAAARNGGNHFSHKYLCVIHRHSRFCCYLILYCRKVDIVAQKQRTDENGTTGNNGYPEQLSSVL